MDPATAAAAAPPEEKEEAEVEALMSPDSPPEGHEGVTASESDKPSMEVRISQEEREPGAEPGHAVEEIVAEDSPAPEAEGEPVPAHEEGEVSEELDPADKTGEESLEAIVEDLKRERGQS